MALNSNAITEDIRVEARAQFIPDESSPEESRYFFAYQIKITNESDHTVQLLSRHWLIINSEGQERTVNGNGVVGKQPILMPGESFNYVSGCPLDTEWGTMEGRYDFQNDDGERFQVDIDRFYLTTTENAEISY